LSGALHPFGPIVTHYEKHGKKDFTIALAKLDDQTVRNENAIKYLPLLSTYSIKR
jgi:hypothetical protein